MINLNENNIKSFKIEILGDEIKDKYLITCSVYVTDEDCFCFPVSKVFNSKNDAYSAFKRLGLNKSFEKVFCSLNDDCTVTIDCGFLGSGKLN